MLALRLGALGGLGAVGLLVLATFVAEPGCKSSETSGGGGGAGGASSSSGSGLFGSGGATNAGGGDAGPLSCVGIYSTVPKGSCDQLAQNCPPGQTCRADNDSDPTQTTCFPLTGLKGKGEDCTTHEECEAGLICVNQCTSPCCRSTNEPCGGGECNVQLMYGNGDYTFVCAFNKSCELLQPDVCPAAYGCHVDDPTQGLATCTLTTSPAVKDQAACHFLNDCSTMEDCHDLGDGDGLRCRYYCYADMTRGEGTPGLGGCPAGQTCITSLNGTAINFGFPGVGLCYVQ